MLAPHSVIFQLRYVFMAFYISFLSESYKEILQRCPGGHPALLAWYRCWQGAAVFHHGSRWALSVLSEIETLVSIVNERPCRNSS